MTNKPAPAEGHISLDVEGEPHLSDSDSDDSNSAATSYSEASAAEFSDMEEDEEQWNDWADDDLVIDDKDVEMQQEGDESDVSELSSEKGIDEGGILEPDSPTDAFSADMTGPLGIFMKTIRPDSPTDSSNGSVKSHYTGSHAVS